MSTVRQILSSTAKNAYVARSCLQHLIDEGFGGNNLYEYEGSPDIFRKMDTLNKQIRLLSGMSLYPRYILVGARSHYGYHVYIVTTTKKEEIDLSIYSLRDNKRNKVIFKNQNDLDSKKLVIRILNKISDLEIEAKLSLIEANINLIEDVILINDIFTKRNYKTVDKIKLHLNPILKIKELSKIPTKSYLLNQVLIHQMNIGRGDFYLDVIKAPVGKTYGNIPSLPKIIFNYSNNGYDVIEHIEGSICAGGYKWLYLVLKEKS